MPLIETLAAILGLAILAVATSYAVIALLAVLVWNRPRAALNSPRLPPVTVLKPLCGAEPGLYANLRTFCVQNYPEYQIVFGVRDLDDPALAVVRRLQTEFPALPIDVVINPQIHGSNFKVSNLINMMAKARHDVLTMADSDATVGSDYLRTVTAPLLDRRVGLVTSIYHDVPTKPIWSRLGAMYINEWYMPSVLLAWLFGHKGYVSGQTLCLRRDTLQAIGSLHTIANHLADDHRLGELVDGLGLRIVLSPYLVRAEHHEPTWRSLTRHELRWMRTIRLLRPRSFCLLFFSFSLPLAMLGLLLCALSPPVSTAAWAIFLTAVGARLALHFVPRLHSDRPMLADLWLLPAHDLLIGWVWLRAFFTSRVTWRGSEFDLGADGVMRQRS